MALISFTSSWLTVKCEKLREANTNVIREAIGSRGWPRLLRLGGLRSLKEENSESSSSEESYVAAANIESCMWHPINVQLMAAHVCGQLWPSLAVAGPALMRLFGVA